MLARFFAKCATKTHADVILYLDTSALAKVFTKEDEWPALRLFFRHRELASSAIARTELLRVALRMEHPPARRAASRLIRRLELIAVDDAILDHAATLQPPSLRTLDAIHIASALRLGPDLEAIVSYDARMAAAAGELGMQVVSPA